MVSSKNIFKFRILVCILLHINLVKSNPVDKKTILDFINVCPSINFVQNSTYLAKCSKLLYPITFNKKDDMIEDIVMCMVIHDITKTICTYNSLHIQNDMKLKLPGSTKEFDEDLKSLEPTQTDTQSRHDDFIKNLCKKILPLPSKEDHNISSDADLRAYVEYAKETFLVDKECPFTCHKPDAVNPFCIVLLWAKNIFTENSHKLVDEKLINKKDSMVTISTAIEKKKIAEQNKKLSSVEYNIKEQAHTSSNIDLQNQTPSQSIVPVKSNEQKTKLLNVAPVDNEQEVKKNIYTHWQLGDQGKEEFNFKSEFPKPVPNTDKVTIIPKPEENSVKSSVQVDENVDNAVFNINSYHNKELKENDIEEDSEHDKLDDIKDGISNEGDFPLQTSVDQSDIAQNRKKNFLHSPAEEDASHIFAYFSIITLLFIVSCFGYHNKQKILAIFLEGRRSRRGRGSRRRSSTASYRKLDSNLEEAVTSQCNSSATHVIY